ncbi:hypothetical protein FXV91_17225 [Methanosarcina sp. DH2]|jgi:Trp operon repressor|uniref:hypothetical protein n=1 Tax=Methanosarcina sp. DH2 TaxID=2605639 RepID=UPI001E5EB4A2|nr:hypothetical protein [Methanosarcina sp. DH2]MCC4771842.1 hypothetical protein [Methanosarcina sp. DH2]
MTEKRKIIIYYFIKNNNEFAYPKEICAGVKQWLINISESGAIEICKSFVDKGILEKSYKRVKRRGLVEVYRLSDSIDVIKLILKLQNEVIVEFVSSNHYQKMVCSVVKYFNEELCKRGFRSPNDYETKYIETYLRSSPSCLRFVLSPDEYAIRIRIQEKITRKLISESLEIKHLMFSSLYTNVRGNQRIKTENKKFLKWIRDENIKDKLYTLTGEPFLLAFLFQGLALCDYYTGHISEDVYESISDGLIKENAKEIQKIKPNESEDEEFKRLFKKVVSMEMNGLEMGGFFN